MKQILSDKERNRLEELIAGAENRIAAQIVLAATGRSDSYAEIPWKAFALSASIAGLLVFLSYSFLTVWISWAAILFVVAAVLATGSCFALLTIIWPSFARLFLSGSRADTETRQYAESLFLERDMFATGSRTGILVLVSLFERRVVILPDKGLRDRLSHDAMKDIIMQMSKPLARGEVRTAMETGLMLLIRILEPTASTQPVKDELSNEIIDRRGI